MTAAASCVSTNRCVISPVRKAPTTALAFSIPEAMAIRQGVRLQLSYTHSDQAVGQRGFQDFSILIKRMHADITDGTLRYQHRRIGIADINDHARRRRQNADTEASDCHAIPLCRDLAHHHILP